MPRRRHRGSDFEEHNVNLTDAGRSSDHFSPDPGSGVNRAIDGEVQVGWDGGSTVESVSDATTITVVHSDNGNDGNDNASG